MVGDRDCLTGAMLNLSGYTAQHNPPTDTIDLGSTTLSSKVRFRVRGTGEGTTLADQSRIFNRFARAANTYRKSEGVGSQHRHCQNHCRQPLGHH